MRVRTRNQRDLAALGALAPYLPPDVTAEIEAATRLGDAYDALSAPLPTPSEARLAQVAELRASALNGAPLPGLAPKAWYAQDALDKREAEREILMSAWRGSSAHVFGLIRAQAVEIADSLAARLDAVSGEAGALVGLVAGLDLSEPVAVMAVGKPAQDAIRALVPLAGRRDALLAAVVALATLVEDPEPIARRFAGPGLAITEKGEQWHANADGELVRSAQYAGVHLDAAGHPVARLIAATQGAG